MSNEDGYQIAGNSNINRPVLTESEIKLARYRRSEREADAMGRIIAVRRLRPSEQTRLNGMTEELTGSDQIKQEDGSVTSISHRTPLFVAASVCEIDGLPIAFPRNRGELDAIYDRLDLEGITAAGKALTRLAVDIEANPELAAKN